MPVPIRLNRPAMPARPIGAGPGSRLPPVAARTLSARPPARLPRGGALSGRRGGRRGGTPGRGGGAGGPIVVVYPDGIWYAGVTPALLERIVVEHLKAGRVVAEAVFYGEKK